MELDPSRRRLVAMLEKVIQKVPTLSVASCMELETFIGQWYLQAQKVQEADDDVNYDDLDLSDLIKMAKREGELKSPKGGKKKKKISSPQNDEWWTTYPLVMDVTDIRNQGKQVELLVKEAGPGRKKGVSRVADEDALAELIKSPKSKKSLGDALARYQKGDKVVPEELLKRMNE